MKISSILNNVNKSNLDAETKAVIYSIIELKAKSEDETIWIMPNSEWRGLPMSELPTSYITASLVPNTVSYIRSENYRNQLQAESDRRKL